VKELLRKWARLEPRMCWESYPYDTCKTAYHVACFPGEKYKKTVSFCADWEYDFAPRLWELQGAVQQAISFRGLDWQIRHESWLYAGQRFSATIWGSRIEAVSSHHKSASLALLHVYVSVLESIYGKVPA